MLPTGPGRNQPEPGPLAGRSLPSRTLHTTCWTPDLPEGLCPRAARPNCSRGLGRPSAVRTKHPSVGRGRTRLPSTEGPGQRRGSRSRRFHPHRLQPGFGRPHRAGSFLRPWPGRPSGQHWTPHALAEEPGAGGGLPGAASRQVLGKEEGSEALPEKEAEQSGRKAALPLPRPSAGEI